MDGLVGDARGEMSAATADAASVQRASSRVLIAVVLLSLLSSGLIVWLYVQRDLLRRLTALSGSMLAVAGGNLRAALPVAKGRDEISRMAAALRVFRDTAVEVEDQGLREIAQARQRLVDAIESISEGFALSTTRTTGWCCATAAIATLLYPEHRRDVMAPGHAVRDDRPPRRRARPGGQTARGRVEEWVAERLATPPRSRAGSWRQHRRSRDRWIRISERRTSGGRYGRESTPDVTDLQVARDRGDAGGGGQERVSRQHEPRAADAAERLIGYAGLLGGAAGDRGRSSSPRSWADHAAGEHLWG